jgi:RNA polymerase sigma factor (sigma-70 family)
MAGRETPEAPGVVGQPVFATTHWSVVLAAADQEAPEAAAALEQLCRIYWYPLYAHIRRCGYSPEDAQDLAQQFFAALLRKDYFRRADPARGRFRNFLLYSLQNFLVNEWHKARALKRGGGTITFPLAFDEAEKRYSTEPATMLTPERVYEKRWAMTLLEQVLKVLQQEYTQAGNSRVFEELADLLWGKEAGISYAQIGARLGMSEGAARAAMHRLKGRFRERLRTEVAHTVADFGEVEEELRHLLSVVSQSD